MLAKFLSRRSEVTVRRSLGASSRDILYQHLVEAGLVGIVGGILGLLFTTLGLSCVRGRSQDYASLVHLDPTIVFYALLASLIGSIAAAIFPAWRICRVSPALNLKGG
jgi:putative ABC transport system permease protein